MNAVYGVPYWFERESITNLNMATFVRGLQQMEGILILSSPSFQAKPRET